MGSAAANPLLFLAGRTMAQLRELARNTSLSTIYSRLSRSQLIDALQEVLPEQSSAVEDQAPRSLRKNRLNGRILPSRELITLRWVWFSPFQRFRTRDFRCFALLGLPDRCRLGTPLGNRLFMPPPSPV
jgi:hypothetical protein